MTALILALLLLQDPPKPEPQQPPPPAPAPAAPAAPDTGEQFAKFKPGTTWTYKAIEHGKPEKKVVMSVAKAEDGTVFVETREFEGDKEAKLEKHRWQIADGLMSWHELKGEKYVLFVHLYKVGSKKGDQWDAGNAMTATHEGAEEVKTGPLTHKDAIRISYTETEKGNPTPQTVSFWLAPNVGLVKGVIQVGPMRHTLELVEFKEGK